MREDYIGKKNFWVISHKHAETGTLYDPEGFDYYGFDQEGYNRNGYNRRGYNREGYNKHGYDEKGRDREGYSRFGYDRNGRDRKGYDQYGYDMNGYNRNGFNRKGINKETGTTYDCAGYNVFGLNRDGRNKNGVADPDVEFALRYYECNNCETISDFAKSEHLSESETKKRISLGRKKCPKVSELICAKGEKKRAQNYAILVSVINKVKSVDDLEAFYCHYSLPISNILEVGSQQTYNFIDAMYAATQMDKVELVIQSLTGTRFDINVAIKAIDSLSPKIKERQSKVALHLTKEYLKKFKVRKLDPCKISKDGGNTWIDITASDIEKATESLRANNKLVCARTIKAFLLSEKQV